MRLTNTMQNDSWNLPDPPGFQGLHPDKPVTMYIRHLPHWRQDGATYFVTFRLADSLPKSKLRQLQQRKVDWERKHPPPRSESDWQSLAREAMQRVEDWLDQGMGSCILADDSAAKLVVKSLHHFDGERYELACYVVMPNHVHLVVRPLQSEEFPLEKILQGWKSWTSREIHLLGSIVGRTSGPSDSQDGPEVRPTGVGEGALWQEESFDRIVRDGEHLYRCIQYIGRNPSRAGRSRVQCRCWLRPEWEPLGWRFEPEPVPT